jgi:hypothetical protein
MGVETSLSLLYAEDTFLSATEKQYQYTQKWRCCQLPLKQNHGNQFSGIITKRVKQNRKERSTNTVLLLAFYLSAIVLTRPIE